MKKIKLGLISVALTIIMVASVYAFIPPPPGPMTPTVDPVSNVVVFIDNASVAVQNTTAQASAYIQGINQKAKAMLSKYVGKFSGFMNGIFKKDKKQPLPGTKEISEAKVADIYDPVSVQKALYKMFLQMPVDCSQGEENYQICEQYKLAALEFYQDTVIEIYTSSRELEKQFDTLETSINEVETALQEGKAGAESTDDQLGVWKNAYNAYETMNSLLKIIEELEAMRAQYIAAQAIGSQAVRPQEPDKKDKQSQNQFLPQTIQTAQSQSSYRSTLSFAQVLSEDEEEKPTYTSSTVFVEAPDSGLKDPFAENAENMKLLDKVYEAYDKLSEAIEVHNQVKNLASMRHVYDGYEKARRLHEKSVEALKTTEHCAINYYSALYTNPHQMWNGGLSDSQLTDQEAHKGISGWAIKAYNLAKAEDTGMMVDPDDFTELNADISGVKGGRLTEIDHNKNLLTKDSAGFKNASQKEKVDAELKDSELIPWNIGAEAAKMIAQDQSKWGQVKKKYPVWKDTQSYYNQYLEGKYNNIANRLELVNTTELALEIAEQLNQEVSSQEEYAHNSEALGTLKAKVSELKAGDVANIEALVKQKENKLNSLYEEKEKKLAQLRKQKVDNLQEINRLQVQIDELNLKLQTANDTKIKAESLIPALETQVKDLYKDELDIPDAEMIHFETEKYQKDLNATIGGKQSYNSTYKSLSHIANAQIFSWLTGKKTETDENKSPEENEFITEQDIKTYEAQLKKTENVEYDESQELLFKEAMLKKNREDSLQAQGDIIDLSERIDILTKKQEKLKQEITDDIEPEMEYVNKQYVIDFNNITLSYDKQINAAEDKNYEKLKELANLDLSKYLKKYFAVPTTTVLGEPYEFSLFEILEEANALVNDARGTARELVFSTLKQMYDLGDDLYDPKNHKKVVDAHQDLMKKLQKLPVNDLKSYGSSISKHANTGKILQLLQTIYQSYMATDACVHSYCMETDDAYFVSIRGKRRDFKAPQVVPSYPLPSVREVVYFDYTTYDSIPQKDGIVTIPDIMKHLTYVPEIWKKILSSPTYIEKDIDLSAIIVPSLERLANAGLYPCIQDEYLVTMDGEKYIVYSRKKGLFGAETDENAFKEFEKKGYAQCQNLEITAKGAFVTVKNIADDVSGSAELKAYSEFKPALNNSELGYIFEYANGLKYNSLSEKSFKRLSDMEKSSDVNGGQKELLYAYLGLNRNQIGEFLQAVDMEQQLKQDMEETSIELKETEKTLKELFQKIGFEPSPDFNLAKESDYTLARNTLIRYRNKLLSAAISTVAPLQGNNNEVIADRMVKINHLIGALQKDDDAYVSLGELSENNAELEESIKAEKINREVSNRQRKEADKDFEKQLLKIGNVFCGELVDNM